MRKTALLLCACLLLCAGMVLSSCNKAKKADQGAPSGEAAQGATPTPMSDKVIGVSLLKENDDFYISMKKGMQDAAAQKGYKIEILSADGDEQKQDKNMDALLLIPNISAIIICPVNSKGVGTIIQKATDKNIPVFTADIAAEQGKVVAHVASDNYMGGKLASAKMAELLGGNGKIAIVQQPGTESVAMRVAGFVENAKLAGLTIIEPYLNGKDDTQESERVANATILSNPDLAGIFAANDNMAGGAEAAITASKKDIKLIGYDASPSAQEKIKAGGPWKADVMQNPIDIGGKTIETIDNFLNGKIKQEEKYIVIPVPVGLFDGKAAK